MCIRDSLSTVNEKIEKGFIVLLEIEVEGAKQIKENFPKALSIFLLPPSKTALEKRIRNRGTEKEEAIDKRLSRADYEIASSDEFDVVLTNHDVDETCLLYTSPSPRDLSTSRMPSSA